MAYTPELGRQFWQAFDDHFKYKAGANGLAALYEAMGEYNRPALEWHAARQAGTFPQAFQSYVTANQRPIAAIADEQREFFSRFFGLNADEIALAFQDFAFGVLASPEDPERKRRREPVHTMNGGVRAADYLSWHGFAEAALLLQPDKDLWTALRWINGMAWELAAKARPQEVFPNRNRPLAPTVTAAIRDKWAGRTEEQIRIEFDNYRTRPDEWMLADSRLIA